MFFVSILHAAKGDKADRVWIQRMCLALLFLFGAAGGYLYALSCVEKSAPDLLEYLDGYRRLFSEGGEGSISLFSAAKLYFGHAFLVFLFGFTAFGVLVIPAIMAEFGFSSMFAVACILQVYGRSGIAMALACLGLRLLVTLPCILWIGAYAWALASSKLPLGRGKRTAGVESGSGYVLRFGVCCLLLLIGIVAECSVTSRAFSWMLTL